MFTSVRWRLIGYVVGVLALMLLAVGGLVFALLTRQLDEAVDAQLRVAAARFGGGPMGRMVAEPATDGIFAIRLIGASGPVGRPPLAGGPRPTGSPTLHELARSGPAPEGLPDMAALAAARVGRDDLRTVTISGTTYRLLTRHFGDGRGIIATQVGISLAARDRQQRIVLLALAAGGALGLACAVAGGLLITDRALAPVQAAFARQRRFVSDASHELRTPLALARLEAEELAARVAAANPAEARAARPLLRQVDRVARLVDDLLTLARLDEAALPLEREPVPAASLLENAAAQAQRLAASDVRVRVDAPPDLWLHVDPQRIAQAMLVLVDNAARATPAGGEIALLAHHEGDTAVIQVQDTGPGIAPEHAARVFERFYRVDTARSQREGGSGLGLAIARDLAEAHGGTLTLARTAASGTTMRLTLPTSPPPGGGEFEV